jgi:hypothetical protein
MSLKIKTTPCSNVICILCYFNIQKLHLYLVESPDLFEVGTWFVLLWTWTLFKKAVTWSWNSLRKTICCLSFTRLCPMFIQLRTAAWRLIVRSWLDVPTFATRRLHARHHARALSGVRWARNVRKFCLNVDVHLSFRDLLHAVKLRHETDGKWAAAGRSPAEIVGSNPTRGMDICLLWVSATSWSLVQRSPTDCGESLCVI